MSTRLNVVHGLAFAAGSALACAASAQIVIDGASRSVTLYHNGVVDATHSNSTSGPWTGASLLPNGFGVSQISSIGANLVEWDLVTNALPGSNFGGTGQYTSRTILTLDFHVDGPMPFQLSGSYFGGGGNHQLTLTRLADSFTYVNITSLTPSTTTYGYLNTMTAGAYRLTIDLGAVDNTGFPSNWSGVNHGSFQISPTPGAAAVGGLACAWGASRRRR